MFEHVWVQEIRAFDAVGVEAIEDSDFAALKEAERAYSAAAQDVVSVVYGNREVGQLKPGIRKLPRSKASWWVAAVDTLLLKSMGAT